MSLKTKLKQLFTGIDDDEERTFAQEQDLEPPVKRLDLPGNNVHELLADKSPPQPTPTHKKHRKYKQHHKAQQHRAGKVVKATKKAEYSPQTHIKGGRIVRTMPKGLQKIKEGQEQGAS
jgi:hypothetical protein